MDYYTEIYVKFAEDYEIYSDEYKNFIEKKMPSGRITVKKPGTGDTGKSSRRRRMN